MIRGIFKRVSVYGRASTRGNASRAREVTNRGILYRKAEGKENEPLACGSRGSRCTVS